VGRLSQSPKVLLIVTGVATAIIAGGATAALAGGGAIKAEAATAGNAVTCSQGMLRNLKPQERTTFTCRVPNALVGRPLEMFANVGVFNAGSGGNYARTSCTLSDGKQLNSGGDHSLGSGGIALQLAARSSTASFDLTCLTQSGTGAQLTGAHLTGIAVGSLTTETL
jgi:hypothetical protein